MGADISKQDQYMIGMIVCACVAGVLLILWIITCWCCLTLKSMLEEARGGSPGTCGKNTSIARDVAWGASPYEGMGQSDHDVGGAYGWMTRPKSGLASSNPYCPSPVGNCCEYGRGVLNPPTGVCLKPNVPSTQLAGRCPTGPGGHCPNTSSIPTYGHGPNTSGAQFVLESATFD